MADNVAVMTAPARYADDPNVEKAAGMAPIGSTGLRVFSGVINEQLLRELRGQRGITALRTMAETDATCGAVLNAITLILRSTTWIWEVNPLAEKNEGEAESEFAAGLFEDMECTFEDFMTEALSMLDYGWSFMEYTIKRRAGPYERSPMRRSKFDDGRIGIQNISPRSQDTLSRWEIDREGRIGGMHQSDFNMSAGTGRTRVPIWQGEVFIPIDQALLFRTISRKNNPEGRSILQNAYRSHYFLRRIQEYEAIGIERELAGVPVVKVPQEILTQAGHSATKALYEQMARDLRFNQQGGLVIPSDTYRDGNGSPTSIPRFEVEVIKGGGNRAIDTNAVKTGYQRDIARTVLADFIMLGTDKGAYNLSESKQTFFMKACEAVLWQITAPINRNLMPNIWALNGLDPATMPTCKPGRLAPWQIDKLGSLLRELSAAGATLFPDLELENFIRGEADLPPKSEEAIAEQDEAEEKAIDTAARQAMALAEATAGNDPPIGDE